MEHSGLIITPLLIAIVLPIFLGIIEYFKERGEKKLPFEGIIRTRPPIMLSGFFLFFGLLLLFGGLALVIYGCINDNINDNIDIIGFIFAAVILVVGSVVGFFGYAFVRFNYVVADNEGILAFRLFRKKRYYRYEEIGYFKDTISLGMMGGVKGYDKNDKKIFAIEAVHIGASAVAQRLREHGVEEKSTNQPNFNLKQ